MRLATEERTEREAVRPGTRNARLGGTDIFRGALVIVTAVVIGGFVISRGLDANDSQEVTSPDTSVVELEDAAQPDAALTGTTLIDDQAVTTPSSPTVSQPAAADQSTSEVAPTETTPEVPSVRPPAEVRVLVLNGAKTQGIAARGTEALLAEGYQTAAPKNATTQRPSAVLFIEGYQAEATEVASVYGPGLETLVQPLDPADPPIDDMQDAAVIVVIGPDGLIPIQ
ncbi:MAG: LytR C-terminal domain-containing protein [Acidimicrobiales bacterium]